MISEVRLTGFLLNGCLVTNQPQSVLKMFLNFYISNTGTTQKCPCVFTVEKSITVETSVQYSIQKYDHSTADRVMTANIKSLAFYEIMTPFPFYIRTCWIFQAYLVLIKMGLYWPNFSLVFLIHLFLYAGVYCSPGMR